MEFKDGKKLLESKTFWGCLAIMLSLTLEAYGVTGSVEIIRNLALIVGVPLTGIGLRDAQY